MRYPVVSHLAFACAIGASVAAAIAPDTSGDARNTLLTRQGTDCSKTAIDSCVAATGKDGTACFQQICVGEKPGKAKRDDDECSEENLLQCAATQDPSDCFQQFCL